jgi:AcrR family transcriptional regulator
VDTSAERNVRADAARNSERIVRAARAAFVEVGPDVPLEEIARRSGVGLRTLYRHFPHKGDLVRAVLRRSVTEDLTPCVVRALQDANPLDGFTYLLETALSLVAQEKSALTAAKIHDSLAPDLSTAFFDALTSLMHRAQREGLLRPDLAPEDLPRIVAMLVSVLWSMELAGEGWHRYVGLLIQGLAPTGASLLPPVPPTAKSRDGGVLRPR